MLEGHQLVWELALNKAQMTPSVLHDLPLYLPMMGYPKYVGRDW